VEDTAAKSVYQIKPFDTKLESCKCVDSLAKQSSDLIKDLSKTQMESAKYQNLYSEAKCKNIAFETKMSRNKKLNQAHEAEKSIYHIALKQKSFRIKELEDRLAAVRKGAIKTSAKSLQAKKELIYQEISIQPVCVDSSIGIFFITNIKQIMCNPWLEQPRSIMPITLKRL
jgi:hypothetical protein